MESEKINGTAKKVLEPCPLYFSKTNWDDSELCKERRTCGLWLIVSRLN